MLGLDQLDAGPQPRPQSGGERTRVRHAIPLVEHDEVGTGELVGKDFRQRIVMGERRIGLGLRRQPRRILGEVARRSRR